MMKKNLKKKLENLIGADAVNNDAADCDFMACDVYQGKKSPILIVSPKTVEQLQIAVRECATAGVAMVPRGGGASYTDGYLYGAGGHVLFDLTKLRQIKVDVENAIVIVEAGATWANLKAELDKLELRTPFWGPFSGIAATVGGSLSQNTLSHGSGGFGTSAESVLSMDVVLASGEMMTTNTSSATRHFGPDMTGLFTGDCGALGIKARMTLPLISARNHFEALSFAFDSFEAYHAADRAASRAKVEDTHFGLSKSLSQGQIGKNEGAKAKLQIAKDIMRSSSSFFAGLKQLLKMGLSGETVLVSGDYMCHYIVEGMEAAEARAKGNYLRELVRPFGKEIANTVPAFVRAMPFAPLTNILGPGGERWVPIHGILPHDKAVAFHKDLMRFYDIRKADMDNFGVWTGEMFSPVSSTGFLYEIALYWPDQRTVYHQKILGDDYLATLPNMDANAEATEYVEQLKKDLIDLYASYDAAYFQIGRVYPYQASLHPEAKALLKKIKTQLDPHNLMNPGVLGIDQ